MMITEIRKMGSTTRNEELNCESYKFKEEKKKAMRDQNLRI